MLFPSRHRFRMVPQCDWSFRWHPRSDPKSMRCYWAHPNTNPCVERMCGPTCRLQRQLAFFFDLFTAYNSRGLVLFWLSTLYRREAWLCDFSQLSGIVCTADFKDMLIRKTRLSTTIFQGSANDIPTPVRPIVLVQIHFSMVSLCIDNATIPITANTIVESYSRSIHSSWSGIHDNDVIRLQLGPPLWFHDDNASAIINDAASLLPSCSIDKSEFYHSHKQKSNIIRNGQRWQLNVSFTHLRSYW